MWFLIGIALKTGILYSCVTFGKAITSNNDLDDKDEVCSENNTPLQAASVLKHSTAFDMSHGK